MPSITDRLTALLDETEAIEKLAASFQASRPSGESKANEQDVKRLREIYLDWFERCMRLFNESGQQAFRSYYSRGTYTIHTYLADPARVRANRKYHTTRGRHESFITGYSWEHPFDKYSSNRSMSNECSSCEFGPVPKWKRISSPRPRPLRP
jgi:hypothetical protein